MSCSSPAAVSANGGREQQRRERGPAVVREMTGLLGVASRVTVDALCLGDEAGTAKEGGDAVGFGKLLKGKAGP